MGIAQKYVLKGQPKKAIKEYLKLIEASPKDKRLYLKLGDLYLKNGESEKAINEYLKLADLCEEEDLNVQAISIYKKILSINSKYIEAFHKIAKLYLKEGLVGSAKNCYQSILEITPDDQEALKALSSIENHQYPEEILKSITPIEPPISKYRRLPGKKVLGEKPSVSNSTPHVPSILSYETETSSPDKDSEMHYHLGIAYKEMELFDYAISEFELASSNSAIKFDCCIMLGNCFMEKGNYDQSIEYYKMASNIKELSNEKLAQLYFNLGLAYEGNGMILEALNTFNQVLEFDNSFLEAQERIKKLQQK